MSTGIIGSKSPTSHSAAVQKSSRSVSSTVCAEYAATIHPTLRRLQTGLKDSSVEVINNTGLNRPKYVLITQHKRSVFDQKSALKIQQCHGDKLLQMGVDAHLVTWITDYLTRRPQFVRLKNCLSDTVICSTGAPQGTVLSPVLFTLYTSDFCYNTESLDMISWRLRSLPCTTDRLRKSFVPRAIELFNASLKGRGEIDFSA
ncbi:hypothetical protein AALO_G00061860 [Alosa alosa]|uniref:Reverse transcriptase domain-containing protein n=1 Tax=Alosa alosa TaxID=278164 RepID=A0AAV6H3K7_9TELE|nr:hypothetical protein AALO_G00061860 [Alosa alosa]